MNISRASEVLKSLFDLGVQEFCICAGARNSPLVYILDQAEGIQLYHFFEERSAAFFALGRMQAHGRPVAVVTTSGTAVAELLPAAIESHYTQKPLVLLTADRPPNYRGTGAPQSIEQIGIFSHYVEATWDLSGDKVHIDFSNWSQKRPIHLNICFAEPLIDAEIPVIEFKKNQEPLLTLEKSVTNSNLEIFLSQNQRPVVIVSALELSQRRAVVEFLIKAKLPIYAEATSGIREHPKLQEYLIRGSDRMLQWGFQKKYFDSVIAVGGVPTLRFWRDLEETYQSTPVFVLNAFAWKGLTRSVEHGSLNHLKNINFIQKNTDQVEIFKKDKLIQSQIEQLIQKYPLSEPSFFRALSMHSKDQFVYLGNSLPIREWDLAAQTQKPYHGIMANRGANGIDGQISSYLGWSEGDLNVPALKQEYWCVIGDLTALYDLISLWVTPQFKNKKIRRRIVVINNQGGQIFHRIFKKDIFINQHQLEFSSWAKMFSWQYQLVQNHENLKIEADNVIVEIQPNSEQTHLFWNEYDLIWQQK